jgi:hypothetical protein
MASLTLIDLEMICHQIAAQQEAGIDAFQPTPKQLYFFTLVWLLKKRPQWQHPEELLVGQDVSTLTERARLVAQHLGDWGAVMTRLRQLDAKEWELLRIQVEKAIKYYPSYPKEVKADSLQSALLKLFDLLNKMISWSALEEADIPALVLQIHPHLTNLYDFGSPFYAFAKRVTRNELISQLRKESRRPLYPISLDDLSDILPAPPVTQSTDASDDTDLQAFCLQLKIDLARLLEIIQHHLPPKQSHVILHTLQSRAAFWRALEATGLPAPAGLSPPAGLITDANIAQVLGMTENSVRVHRAQAKKPVKIIDSASGLLLESLLTGYGEISYRPKFNVGESAAYNHDEGDKKG